MPILHYDFAIRDRKARAIAALDAGDVLLVKPPG